MKKKYIYILCVCTIAFLTLLIVSFCVQTNASIHMFAELNECDKIVTNAEGGTFLEYRDTALDTNIGGLRYTDFFAGIYNCSSCSFEIFAYVFDDDVAAQEYFRRSAGKSIGEIDPNFSLESGVTSARLVVLRGNMAYTVHMPVHAMEDVLQLLSSAFSIKVA